MESRQVRYQVVDLLIAELHGRHQRSGLKVIWILNPRMQILRRVHCRSGGDRRSTFQMRQVRPEGARRRGSRDGVAIRARLCFKNVTARGHAGILHCRAAVDVSPTRQTVRAYPRIPAAASWRVPRRRTARTARRTNRCAGDRSTYRSDDSESDQSCRPAAAPRSCDPRPPTTNAETLASAPARCSPERAARSPSRCPSFG